MLQEQEKKKRRVMARQEQDGLGAAAPGNSATSTSTHQDSLKRRLEARQQQDELGTPAPGGSTHPLPDYQMQLILLQEPKKKKRRIMARQEQDGLGVAAPGSSAITTPQRHRSNSRSPSDTPAESVSTLSHYQSSDFSEHEDYPFWSVDFNEERGAPVFPRSCRLRL